VFRGVGRRLTLAEHHHAERDGGGGADNLRGNSAGERDPDGTDF